jgi:hypothetical protein
MNSRLNSSRVDWPPRQVAATAQPSLARAPPQSVDPARVAQQGAQFIKVRCLRCWTEVVNPSDMRLSRCQSLCVLCSKCHENNKTAGTCHACRLPLRPGAQVTLPNGLSARDLLIPANVQLKKAMFVADWQKSIRDRYTRHLESSLHRGTAAPTKSLVSTVASSSVNMMMTAQQRKGPVNTAVRVVPHQPSGSLARSAVSLLSPVNRVKRTGHEPTAPRPVKVHKLARSITETASDVKRIDFATRQVAEDDRRSSAVSSLVHNNQVKAQSRTPLTLPQSHRTPPRGAVANLRRPV